jgi:hypothetical protein
MINWIRRKLHSFLYPDKEINIIKMPSDRAVRECGEADIEGMRFTVMPAEGGTIVQMRIYDRRKDENHTKTYVIPDTEQDIAHRIGQIVALELIRQ